MTYPEVCYSKIESNAANKNLAGPAKEEAVGEEFQTVNYIGLIPILIKEIQVLKERIKILEKYQIYKDIVINNPNIKNHIKNISQYMNILLKYKCNFNDCCWNYKYNW